jgi:hypothetical protein
MSKILCLSHHGIRCGIPVDRVLDARQRRAEDELVDLWDGADDLETDWSITEESGVSERSLNIRTADGARWIRGEQVATASVASHQVRPLPPLLREIVTLPYVVGLADLRSGGRTREGELIWLVDPLRFLPGSALKEAGE